MATNKQKQAARRNLEKAREARSNNSGNNQNNERGMGNDR